MSRLDKVTIAYSRGTVTIPWDSRDELLKQIRHLASAAGAVRAFEAVGASRPVVLPDADAKAVIVEAINLASRAGLPEGLWDLRCALVDDLHDTAGGP